MEPIPWLEHSTVRLFHRVMLLTDLISCPVVAELDPGLNRISSALEVFLGVGTPHTHIITSFCSYEVYLVHFIQVWRYNRILYGFLYH